MAEWTTEQTNAIHEAILAADAKGDKSLVRELAASLEAGNVKTSGGWGTGIIQSGLRLGSGLMAGIDRAGDWLEKQMPITPGYDPDKDVSIFQQAEEGIDKAAGTGTQYKPDVSWQDVKDDPTVGNIMTFGVDAAVTSAPDMAAIMASLPVYVFSRLVPLAEERAENDGRTKDEVTPGDVAAAGATATGSALLERFGLKGIFGAGVKPATKRVGQAIVREAGTEAAQTGIEHTGTRAGTTRGVDSLEMLDEMAGSAVGGGVFGGTGRVGVEIGSVPGKMVSDVETGWEYGLDEDRLLSDERVSRQFDRKVASMEEADIKQDAAPWKVFRSMGEDLKDGLSNTATKLKKAGVLTPEETKSLTSVFNKAKKGTHVLDQADFDVINNLGSAFEVNKTILDSVRDLNTIMEASRDKNTRGPIQRAMSKVASPLAVGVGVKSGIPGLGLAASASAQTVGRMLDTVARTREPTVLKRRDARTRRIEKAKGKVTDPVAELKALYESLEAGDRPASDTRAKAMAEGNKLRASLRGMGRVSPESFDGLVEARTGLNQAQIDEALMELLMREEITPSQHAQFYASPESLTQGKQGLRMIDLMNTLDIEGRVAPVAPQAQAGPAQSAPHVVNPVAYEATVRSAEAGRDAAYSAIQQAGPAIGVQAQQALIGLTDNVVAAKSKSEKLALLTSAMQQMPAPVRAVAEQVIAPLTQYGPANPAAAPNNPVVTPDRPAGAGPAFRPGMGRGGPTMAPETGSGPGSVTMPNPAMGQAPAPAWAAPAPKGALPTATAKKYPIAPHDEWYGNRQYKEQGGKMVEMTPDDYLAKVRPLELDETSIDNIEDLANHIESGRTLDPLIIYPDGKEDGRHRAYAAKKLGIGTVPVIVFGDVAKVEAAKAENEPNRSATGHPMSISTRMLLKDRRKGGKVVDTYMPEGDQHALDKELGIGMADMLGHTEQKTSGNRLSPEDKMARNTALLNSYPGMSMPGLTPEETYAKFRDRVSENLLYIYDAIEHAFPGMREQTRLWYVGANKLAGDLGATFNRPVEQMAAVMAALSPQKDWYMNYSLGERVVETFDTKQDHQWDSEMDKVFNEKAQTSKLLKGLSNRIKGSTLKELVDVYAKSGDKKDSVPIAAWIRMYDEAYNGRGHRLISPDGSLGDFAVTKDGVMKGTGWGSLVEISKAVRVLMDGSRESINKEMGTKHKVRNFYNNILDPMSAKGEVTVDTHQVAAGVFMPYSGQSREVHHNFGSSPSKEARGPDWDFAWADNKRTGASGSYGLYADGTRQAAAERGILPREMQSITWEAIRGLFPASWKNKKNYKAVKAIWDRADKGEISRLEARDLIVELAGGWKPPTWVTGIVEEAEDD